MVVWRLTKRRYADLSGRGGEVADGRWHTRGRPIVYCAATAALAVLEVRVHLDLVVTPGDYVLMGITVPETVAARTVSATDLPAGWQSPGGEDDCRAIGDDWLETCSHAILIVPSAIIAVENNVLLNPRHPDTARLPSPRLMPFAWDDRLL
jgi:RES domain-containing protein